MTTYSGHQCTIRSQNLGWTPPGLGHVMLNQLGNVMQGKVRLTLYLTFKVITWSNKLMYSDTHTPRDPNMTPIEQKGVCYCNKLDYLVNREKIN